MTYLIIFIVGAAVGYWWGGKNALKDPKREKVIGLFKGKPEISNDDVEVALSVSDSTATRYLDELEQLGVIEQVGDTGAGVVYRRK